MKIDFGEFKPISMEQLFKWMHIKSDDIQRYLRNYMDTCNAYQCYLVCALRCTNEKYAGNVYLLLYHYHTHKFRIYEKFGANLNFVWEFDEEIRYD